MQHSRTRQTSLPGFGDEAEPVSSVSSAPPPQTDQASPPATDQPRDRAAPSVWVVDSHSLIHQVFHALPPMTSPSGAPVGAVFGFTRDLLYLLEDKRPQHLFCAFDLPGKTFRHEMFDEYKLQRAEMPDELKPQIPAIRRVIAALGIPALACESFEADDVLATVARQAEERKTQCYLVTNDKDARQLLTDRVAIYSIRKNEVYDAERLAAEWGIAPNQVVDYQALVGDTADNVPGVPMIGPKFAKQLIEQYGTLENILAHAEEVSGTKRRENLCTHREQAMLSRDLVRLNSEVPLAIDWQPYSPARVDRAAAQQLFDEFGFRNMGAKLDAVLDVLANG